MFDIKEELKKLPEKPGVYIMKDKNDNIIYVGKAIVLKNRVRQYFQKTPKSDRILKMVSLIDHFEYIVVENEMEALILECNLIKLHRPKYNVLLKDDKMYPYIKITIKDDYPTVKITRKKFDDGSKYYGPYSDAYAVKETVEFINTTFKIKQCKKVFKKGKAERACLNYHIGKCMGICLGNVSKEEYRKTINQVMMILDGKVDEILKTIKNEIEISAKQLDFEKAAMFRDKMNAITNLVQRQRMDNFSENNIDVIGIVKKLNKASIEIFTIRNSKMIGGNNFILDDASDITENEIIINFMKQYYNSENVPNKIMFKYDIEEQELMKAWLSEISGRKNIEFKIPKKGEKLRFIEMAEENAQIALSNKTTFIEKENILLELKEVLNLDKLPNRIESYDISNISGDSTVSGMVVFEYGKAKKNEYRRLKIKTVDGQNDIACMKETLERRLKYCVQNTIDKNPFGPMPDLILMDGGINQVNIAKQVISELGLNISVCGMVKNDKHQTRALINIEGEEVSISDNDKLYNFIANIQNEVHKTAIEYHRKLRDKKMTSSSLDNVPGIGDVKKKELLKKFKSIEKIKEADIKELCEIKGINESLAKIIKENIK